MLLPAYTSGVKSSSALIRTGPCLLTHIAVITDGVNKGTITVYDNTEASGTVVWKHAVKGTEEIGGRNWQFPIRCSNGLYAAISGTNATYIVEWLPYAPQI